MYAQVEKAKEINSSAVANSVIQNKSKVKQGFGIADNRFETIAQRNLQETILPNKPITQRAVPTGNRRPNDMKEIAYTPDYQAKENKAIYANNIPRSVFSFGKYTKLHVLEKYGQYKSGPIPTIVMTQGGQAVPIHSIQIDHAPIPWSKIHENMVNWNNDPNNTAEKYTLCDARAYYNDNYNLQPELAGINAGYGDGDRPAPEQLNPIIRDVKLHLEGVMAELQHKLNATAQNAGMEKAEEISMALTDAYQGILKSIGNLEEYIT